MRPTAHTSIARPAPPTRDSSLEPCVVLYHVARYNHSLPRNDGGGNVGIWQSRFTSTAGGSKSYRSSLLVIVSCSFLPVLLILQVCVLSAFIQLKSLEDRDQSSIADCKKNPGYCDAPASCHLFAVGPASFSYPKEIQSDTKGRKRVGNGICRERNTNERTCTGESVQRDQWLKLSGAGRPTTTTLVHLLRVAY